MLLDIEKIMSILNEQAENWKLVEPDCYDTPYNLKRYIKHDFYSENDIFRQEHNFLANVDHEAVRQYVRAKYEEVLSFHDVAGNVDEYADLTVGLEVAKHGCNFTCDNFDISTFQFKRDELLIIRRSQHEDGTAFIDKVVLTEQEFDKLPNHYDNCLVLVQSVEDLFAYKAGAHKPDWMIEQECEAPLDKYNRLTKDLAPHHSQLPARVGLQNIEVFETPENSLLCIRYFGDINEVKGPVEYIKISHSLFSSLFFKETETGHETETNGVVIFDKLSQLISAAN